MRASDDCVDNALLEVQRLWPPFLGGRRIAKEVMHTILCLILVSNNRSRFLRRLPHFVEPETLPICHKEHVFNSRIKR